MIESRDYCDFAQKSIGSHRSDKIRVEDLERDDAVMPGILCEVDGSHATAAQLAIDCIGGSQKLPNALNGRHEPSRKAGLSRNIGVLNNMMYVGAVKLETRTGHSCGYRNQMLQHYRLRMKLNGLRASVAVLAAALIGGAG